MQALCTHNIPLAAAVLHTAVVCAHLDGPLPLLAELADLPCRNAPHNLGQCEPAAITALAHPAQQWPQQPALGVEPLLIVLGG